MRVPDAASSSALFYYIRISIIIEWLDCWVVGLAELSGGWVYEDMNHYGCTWGVDEINQKLC